MVWVIWSSLTGSGGTSKLQVRLLNASAVMGSPEADGAAGCSAADSSAASSARADVAPAAIRPAAMLAPAPFTNARLSRLSCERFIRTTSFGCLLVARPKTWLAGPWHQSTSPAGQSPHTKWVMRQNRHHATPSPRRVPERPEASAARETSRFAKKYRDRIARRLSERAALCSS